MDNPDFPIGSKTSLWRWIKTWFCIQTNKQRHSSSRWSIFYGSSARYLTAIEKFRSNDGRIFWHDETWCNQYEVKSYI